MTTEKTFTVVDPVDLKLAPEELNLILLGLESLTYRTAKPVIDEIHRQVIQQLMPPPGVEPGIRLPPLPNGGQHAQGN